MGQVGFVSKMPISKPIRANVLVTGAGGFLGSRAVISLLESGAQVKALCHSKSGTLEKIKNPNLEIVGVGTSGILDQHVLAKAMENVKVVYHFAINWTGHIWNNTETLDTFVHDNLRGTLNVLQASKDLGVKQFLYASSAVVYGFQKSRVVNEQDVCRPETWARDPGPAYPIMKLTAEKMCHICAKAFGFQLTIFRVGVVFDEKKAILPDPIFVQRILRGENIEVEREVGRTSIHVDDVVQAFLSATLNPKAYGQIFNLSNPATFISDKEMYKLLIDTVGSKSKIVLSPKPVTSPAIESMMKTKRVLGWKARKNLQTLKSALIESIPANATAKQ